MARVVAVDEVRFGPEREFRLLLRYQRVLAAIAVTGGVAAVVLAGHGSQRGHPAVPAPQAVKTQPACSPAPAYNVQSEVGDLPTGARPGALAALAAAEYSSRCASQPQRP